MNPAAPTCECIEEVRDPAKALLERLNALGDQSVAKI